MEDVILGNKEVDLLVSLEISGKVKHEFVVNISKYIIFSKNKALKFRKLARLCLNDLLNHHKLDEINSKVIWDTVTFFDIDGTLSPVLFKALKDEIEVRKTAMALQDVYFEASVRAYLEKLLGEFKIQYTKVIISKASATIYIFHAREQRFDKSLARLLFKRLRVFCAKVLGFRDARFLIKFVKE